MAKGKKPVASTLGPILARLFPDLPPDEATAPQFEFEGLAKTLAELALNPENRTPFTLVVKGGWGRGKTTLLRRAKGVVEHPGQVSAAPGLRKVETLWFNAWKYPSVDSFPPIVGLLQVSTKSGQLQPRLEGRVFRGRAT